MKFSCLPLRTLTVLAASSLAVLAHAQVAVTDQQAHEALLKERAQVREQLQHEITQQRQQIEANKLEAEKACWQRFAVEGCLRDVRAQAREQDNVLRARELDINNEARQEKAAERLRAIEQKKNEKQASAPVTTNVRGKEAAAVPSVPTSTPPVDIEQAQAERTQAAQARAAETQARVAKQQAAIAEHETSDAERRAKVKKNMQDKQQAADARRASKADDIAKRKGAPLPIPAGLPKP